MPSARFRIPIYQQDFPVNSQEFDFHDQPMGSFSDMVFGFLEHGEDQSFQASPSSEDSYENEALDEEEDEEKENGGFQEDKSFWDNQHQLLQATLCRTSSLESGIRNITKETIKEIQMAGTTCGCGKPMVGGCRKCLMAEVSGRLRNAGYNSAICKSKWRSSPDIPSGEHTFLDVIDNSSSKKGEIRVIIELNFQAEFEMAKASEEYNSLVRKLPEIFVGKVERLNNVIKILCLAAKKCMKQKKMHLGPWRKRRYMQAKWLGTCERTVASIPSFSMGYSGKVSKPKSSMLTVDLLDLLPNMHCTAVEVV
ncbi:uncharacterized protein LOC8288057 [Ricinus communis]|uniref:Uncharacterized protein n=1 Tax=Ricinus communis TaxID=3988 RepID=B9RBD3_RICCO|nr:uncharacterized protein LOC8288057 [Ricinus communis]EEF50854.1 conserved hypothetical protein [Ricinus communis]|eukprot:XP_002509467.1 uncharacterized protein LOC8288057 [Ricinus communis]